MNNLKCTLFCLAMYCYHFIPNIYLTLPSQDIQILQLQGFYSVVMLTLVDADYRFLMAEVGSNGSCSDAQIFKECQLKQSILDQTIRFPDRYLLPGDDRGLPYFIVVDEAFALKTWLIKPF